MAEIVVRLIIEQGWKTTTRAKLYREALEPVARDMFDELFASDPPKLSVEKKRRARVQYTATGRRRPRPLVQPTLDALLASPNQTMKLRTLAQKLRRPVSDFYRIRHQRSDLFETPKRGYIKASVPS